MRASYWERRINRRQALRGIAAAGAGAASLALLSCGGGGGEEETRIDRGNITAPVDTTKQAKRGGVYMDYAEGDETNLDPFTTSRGAGSGGFELPAYQKLLREKPEVGGSKTQTFVGDAAESFELTDGGLRLVAKIRPNNKFDPRPPTSGRAMTAKDVAYSWDRLEAQSTYASVLSYKRSEGAAPVESVTAVDDRTVVYKMAFPWSALLAGIAEGGPHQIGPIEVEDKFNPKNTVRGSGPWMLDYEPSVVFKWRRNPGFYNQETPFIEGYDQPILPEYAARLAQFRAKRIWDMRPTNPADIPGTVQESPGLQVYQGEVGISHLHMWFSGRPTNPFRDVRLRRAASMALDRPLFAEVISEAVALKAGGIPPTIVINNNIPGGAGDFWLDPFGKEMGEAAQYFKFNQAEARKLISAAGFPGGLDVVARVSTRTHGNGRESEIALQMLREVGFRVTNEPADYNNVFLPNILSARGDWDGNISFSGGGMGFSPATGLQRVHHPQGGTTRVSWLGQPWDDGHKKIADMIEKALREIDTERYRSLIYDLQREIGQYQSAVIVNYQATPFDLVWPWVQNWGVWRLTRPSTENKVRKEYLWIDDTKKT